jgi:tetratricopeptide (TPR) repeat protein
MERGNDEAAVTLLEGVRDRVQPTPEYYHQLGRALTKLGRLEEARTTLAAGAQAFPDSPEIGLQLGQTQLQLGQFAEAEASLRQATAAGADPETGWFALANALARQGKQDEAADFRKRLAELKASRQDQDRAQFQSRYLAAVRRIAVPTMSRAALVYHDQGDPEEAERLLLRAIALDPAAVEPYAVLAGMLRGGNRTADLRLVHERLVEVEPQNAVHYLNLASVASQLGDFDAAEPLLQRAVELRPDVAIGYTALAQLYLRMDRPQQARWSAEAALRRQPTAEGYLLLAAACQTLGDAPAAQAAVAEARQLAPDDPRWNRPAQDE